MIIYIVGQLNYMGAKINLCIFLFVSLQTRKQHFWYPPKHPKWVILGVFGYFGGTENGTSGAQIKILRSLFNTNTPLKPPFSHFGNNFRPPKSDFWPFY